MTTKLIKAVRLKAGGWVLVDFDTGERIGDTPTYPTYQAAYKDCETLWMPNSIWQGRRVRGGYRITL